MPRFVQLSGDRAGKSYPAAEDAVLGRDASCELSFAEGSISRRHARLIYQEGDWQLVDMESRNGLFFNEARVPSCTLQGGEEVRLGKLRLRFHLDSGEDYEGGGADSEVAENAEGPHHDDPGAAHGCRASSELGRAGFGSPGRAHRVAPAKPSARLARR